MHRTLLIVFMLLSAAGGVARVLPAQTAPQDYLFYLTSAGYGRDRVCSGDTASLSVIAERSLANVPAGTPPGVAEPVDGMTVFGFVDGSLTRDVTPYLVVTSLSSNPPGSASFTYTAGGPGMVRFTLVGYRYDDSDGVFAVAYGTPGGTEFFSRSVKVVDCDLPAGDTTAGAGRGGSNERRSVVNQVKVPKAKAPTTSKINIRSVSTWNAGMTIVATIDDGVMDADNQRHFTGSANVKWRTSVIGGAGCGAAENVIEPSTADLAGQIDENNQLVVTITFGPRDFSGFASCGGVTRSTANVATPNPLTVTVTASGGASIQEHAVTAKNGSFMGSATIIVVPVHQ